MGSWQAFRAGSSRGPADRSDSDWFGERDFGKALVCSAPSSTGKMGCDFPGKPLSQGARDGTRVCENATKLTIIVAVQPFFLKELSLGCCKALVSSQNSEEMDSASFLVAFMER